MSDLIERLEKAKGPDRGLFEQAFFASFGKVPKDDNDAMARWLWFQRLLDAGAWTDAALTLVPEDWQWEVSNNAIQYGHNRSIPPDDTVEELGPFALLQWPPKDEAGGSDWFGEIRCAGSSAATPALAICIAALKARAAQ